MTKLVKKRVRRSQQILPRTPVSTPTEEGAGDISTWQIFQPILNREKCTKCNLCWLYCPEGAIRTDKDNAIEIDVSHCKGCGICAKECPMNAIFMKFKGENKDAPKRSRKW